MTDEAAENDRLNGGQASKAGVGEIDGEGDESPVRGGEFEALLSVAEDGLIAIVGVTGTLLVCSCIMYKLSGM